MEQSVYRGIINLDFKVEDNNSYQKIVSALIQAGWTWTRTSSFVIETPSISRIWAAAELLAKGSAHAGVLRSLALQVQLIDPEHEYSAAKNHPNALEDILKERMPRIKPADP